MTILDYGSHNIAKKYGFWVCRNTYPTQDLYWLMKGDLPDRPGGISQVIAGTHTDCEETVIAKAKELRVKALKAELAEFEREG